MNKRNVAYFRKRLESQLQELTAEVDCNFDGLHRAKEELPDLIDRASRFTNRSLSQNICDRKTFRIRKIERALEDLANGLYGTCQRCGEDIAIKRLKANPVARYCIDCKTEIETRERLTGSLRR